MRAYPTTGINSGNRSILPAMTLCWKPIHAEKISRMTTSLKPGDPVPWFEAQALAGTEHSLGVMAGRWIALFFGQELTDAAVTRTLADIVASLGRFFNDDHVIFYGVLTAPPATAIAEHFAKASHRGLGFMTDYDGTLTKLYGASEKPYLVVIDPLLRAKKIFSLGTEGASSQDICAYLNHLPPVDDFAGIPLLAPALVIPNVFESEFCDFLVGLHQKNGGTDSGFMLDKDGKTQTIINHELQAALRSGAR